MDSVLRHRDFRNFILAAFGASLGTLMEMVGVQWLMAEQTRSPAMMSWLTAAQLGPILLLGLVGGLVADAVDRRRLLIATQAAMMIVAGALTAFSALGRATPAVLMVLAVAHGVAAAFNIPVWQTMTPRLVPREDIQAAITLGGVQFNLARVIGPALGGVVMARWGPTALFAANTLSFLGVMLAVWLMPPEVGRLERAGRWRVADALRAARGSLGEGFRFVFREPGPRAVFLALMLYSLLGIPMIRFLPLFTTDVYGREEAAYGALMSALGVGAVAGGLALRHIPTWYPKHHLLPLSLAAGGFAMLVFSAMDRFSTAAAALVVAGVFWIWVYSVGMSAMQLLAPDRMRGRVLSICSVATFGALPIGAAAASAVGAGAGFLRERLTGAPPTTGFEVQMGVGLLAVACALAGLTMLVWRTPEVDGLKPGDPGYDRRPGLVRGVTARAHRAGAVPAVGE